ncbi:H-NS histone family protein [Paracidovorax citrulli]
MSIDLSGLSAKELGALIKNAKKQQTIVAKRPALTKVRAQLAKLAKANGYTLEEVAGVAAAGRSRAGTAGKAAPARKAVRKLGKVAPKYRNPANPKETWTGRGKQPRWLAAHTTKGKKLEDFLIKK